MIIPQQRVTGGDRLGPKKFGTQQLCRRLEARRSPVRVFCVRPGFVRGTELGRETHWLLRALAAPIIWLVSKSLDQVRRKAGNAAGNSNDHTLCDGCG